MTEQTAIQLNYIDSGNGPAVVLVHGMAASLCDWTLMRTPIEQAGFRTITPDLLGHGDSPKPDDPQSYKLKDVYSTLESWLETLGLDKPVHLVGHSLGGYLSIKYALRFPKRVQSLTLINSLYYIGQLAPMLRIFRRKPRLGVQLMGAAPLQIIETFMAWDPTNPEHFPPETTRQMALDYKRASPHILNITRHIPDLTPMLSSLRPPTLVIWGDSDLTLDPASFPRMVARIPNVAGYHRIQGSGHLPHLGKPHVVNPLVLDFITEIERSENQGMR